MELAHLDPEYEKLHKENRLNTMPLSGHPNCITSVHTAHKATFEYFANSFIGCSFI